ncbi:hypothetical protein H6P81_008431 [Aristolochia fimbriata]|uniref:Uncharacterized protein n=1 Tax=Aristolochia fimbriata TaxID=158543 RepID=A0AAV7EKS3_ARIFI|nr:hypothetical protein H6P81_008431 [Aristolochia fimbriata]
MLVGVLNWGVMARLRIGQHMRFISVRIVCDAAGGFHPEPVPALTGTSSNTCPSRSSSPTRCSPPADVRDSEGRAPLFLGLSLLQVHGGRARRPRSRSQDVEDG